LNLKRADDDIDESEKNQAESAKEAKSNENNAAAAAFAALGVAALGLGAYAAYKCYFNFNKDDKLPSFVNSKSDCVKLLEKMNEDINEFPVIGLDCQWVINKSPYEPRNPVALLQVATRNRVMLVPMKKFTFPQELRYILNNSEIIKTGIEVIKDARYLREDHGLEVQSTFDIRFLAEDTGHRPVELEGLSKDVLDLNLSFEKENVNSDWNKSPLDKKQISYAEAAVKANIDMFTVLYPFTNSGTSSIDVLAYCNFNKDKPFVWNTQKWDFKSV
jgi:ribonuclease D